MALRSLAIPFRFASGPVTALTVVLYGFIFWLALYTDELFDVPKDTRGLDLDRAYADLHKITSQPHPFLSHTNDDVRTYLLSQVESIAAEYDHVHVSDDTISNASWVADGPAVYFEGNNILVKIDGTDPPLSAPHAKPNGIMFSVHFDSVSTAPGATDDGMGVTTLLELIRYFATPERRPRRTAVFFFNNGEEDGLNGAYLYFKHPWSNLTSTFVNLEGAASGGRPILFRSTSLAPVRAFASGAISHLQADVLSSDAFKRGLIRSRTDFQVYAAGLKGQVEPMSGVDFAFWKNRAYYHTPYDSIPGMGYGEGRKALWSMLEATRGAGIELLNGDDTSNDNGQPGVYFDLFKYKLVLFSLQSLLVTNIVMLVIAPITTLILLAMLFIVSKKSLQERAVEESIQSGSWTKGKKILRVILGWGRFWIALIVGIAAHVGLVVAFVKINPYVVHSHPYLVLVTFLSLSFLAVTCPLQLLQFILPSSPSSQKLAVLLEHFLLAWILLIVATIQIQKYKIGGVYWITAWYICTWLASSVSLVEGSVRGLKAAENARKAGLDLTVDSDYDESSGAARRLVSGVRYDAQEHPDGEDRGDEQEGEIVETEPTEITPLIHQRRRNVENGGVAGAEAKYKEYGWWIAQMLLAVPLPALLVFQIELIQLQSLMNTLVDGSDPVIVYGGLAILSLIIFIPLAPFAHRVHPWLTLITLVVFVLTLAASWAAPPFTQERPFKVYFQQQVEVDISSNTLPHSHSLAMYPAVGDVTVTQSSNVVHAVTVLTGLSGYIDRRIVPEMPSSWGRDVRCHVDNVTRTGLYACGWESELLPSPGGTAGNDITPWLDVRTARLNATSATISVRGANTRGCRLYFDRPVTRFAVLDAARGGVPAEGLPGYELPEAGTRELRLWTRTWGAGFEVELGWEGAGPLSGRAACEWAEYASASASGRVSSGSGLIPALEEVKAFLPLWAVPTKATDGLVEVWTRFEI
ncbi:uncharacterized protein FIBRA_03585 [Fibroporia radiculosa]|uniref:Peptide hydrolase n=1 Tax=Fibroporia radiculosa TaxID=599839 RepID=J4H2H4_9APHY|nr:uncharacterized protein FIBRA_03585 [Fibroporia radiculosa]CCM01529.1 predicted protein [Fibroporia radiculosa]